MSPCKSSLLHQFPLSLMSLLSQLYCTAASACNSCHQIRVTIPILVLPLLQGVMQPLVTHIESAVQETGAVLGETGHKSLGHFVMEHAEELHKQRWVW